MDILRTPLESLLSGTREKYYDHGQMIFYTGDPPTETIILTEGVVKVFDIDDRGQEKVLQIIKAPAVLPLDNLPTPPRPAKWQYSALTNVKARAFSTEELHTHIKQNPDLGTYIITWLANESHELLARIDSMSKTDAREKILAVLRFLSVYYTSPEKRGWRRVQFPVTHQLLANITGITRESVTIQMGRLQQEKIIRARRPYLELHTAALLR